MKRGLFLTGLLCGTIMVFTECSIVPITGRKQLNILPQATLVEMGLTTYTEFLKVHPVSKKLASARQVEEVGHRVSSAVNQFLRKNGLEEDLKNFQWEFKLVADTTPNAWCLPGGKVVFYEGILPYTQNESGIAVVMGHEIAHAVAHHGNERMSQGLLTELGGLALTKAIESKPEQTRQIFQVAFGLGSQLGIVLPYSRMHEREADRLGLIFMAMAKYDPNYAVSFWERMAKANSGPRMPAWLSTHPLDESRIADMKTNLPEAIRYYQAAISAGK